MARKTTMKDVAREAGVSVMTVSRAFRPNSSIGYQTRERILSAAAGLGYVVDATASNLRARRTDFVAAIVPSIDNANFADTVKGMTAETDVLGLQLLLGTTDYRIDREEALIHDLLRHRPLAIVLTGGNHTPRARQLLEGADIPVIESWDLPADPIGHVVGFSNAACMEFLVAHLAERGHRRIAFMGGDSSDDTRGADRRRGFVAAMRSRGLNAERLVAAGTPPISMREGADAMVVLLERWPDTDAVICVSDVAAFGALAECQRRGIGVPDDMALAGFGAHEIARICNPTITTVDPGPVQIGTRIGNLIVQIAEDNDLAPQHIAVEPRLLIGGTT